jgi:hypothetical protein
MYVREWQAEPFRNSLSALALVAMRAAGADGYAFFERLSGSETPRRLAAFGATIPESAVTGGSPRVLSYSLRTNGVLDGVLAFAFSEPSELVDARIQMDHLARTISAVWAVSETTHRYVYMIERISSLEAQLIDSKIAERVCGLKGGNSDLGAAIARHVEGVLRHTPTPKVLEELLAELGEEMEGRRVASLAKYILQSNGMTEEEAHLHLRTESRRLRKRLKDVAAELIERSNISEQPNEAR